MNHISQPNRAHARSIENDIAGDSRHLQGGGYNFHNPNEYAMSPEETVSLIDFWKILNVLRKWWWLIALIMTVFTALTALILLRMQPLYLASTTVEIKQEERNIIDVSEVENVIADKEFMTTQIELLQADSLAENVIEKLNLLSDTGFYNAESEAWNALPRADRLRSITKEFNRRLRVAPIGRSRLIKLSFEHTDPQRAAEIVNTTVDTFIANSLDRKFNTTQYAREFLEDRLKTVKGSLEQSEREFVEYASRNNIIIVGNNADEESTGSLDASALVALDTELTVARTNRFAAEAAYKQALDNAYSAEALDNTALSTLRADRIALQSEYREKSARFKPQFPEMVQLASRIELLDKEIAAQEGKIVSTHIEQAKAAFLLAQAQENDLAQRVRTLKSSVINVREKGIDYNILRRQVETNRTQYDALLQRLKEVSVADNLGSNLVQVVDVAKAPLKPYKPNKVRSMILVVLLSAGLGLGLALAIEMIDDRIKSPDDVKTKLNQIILGVTPVVKTPKELLSIMADPQSGIAEAYSSLRTNLQYSGPDGGPKVIQLTSTRSGEGKSVSSLGLALRIAGLQEKVLLIDCDMRLPTFTQDAETIGLSGLLTQNTEFAPEILTSRFENLHLLPSGASVPNPADLLASARFDELLAFARENYKYVIVDSPPILGLADALILGAKVDATLLIAQSRLLRTPAIKASIERFLGGKTKLLGVVLTKYKAESQGYMDYYKYTYGGKSNQYGPAPKRKTSRAKSKQKFDVT